MSSMRQSLGMAEVRASCLKTSLLADAFAGRLAPQDPDDEPAGALLERIGAELAAQNPKKRTRKKVAT